LKRKPPKFFVNQLSEDSDNGLNHLNALADWYMSLKAPCPFHYKGACTIYDQRPLACREYFVKGSARACRRGRGMAEVVEIPIRMGEVLGQLASELEGRDAEAVMMPLALVWCEENIERNERTWPEAMMIERFVEIVEARASENSAAVAASA
jgi:Fe-S-cluster containining protein